MSVHSRDSAIFSNELVKKLIKSAVTISYNNFIEKSLPDHSVKYTEKIIEKMYVLSQCQSDSQQNDYADNGLVEDQEPISGGLETWIRAKIIVDKQSQEDYDSINDLPNARKNSPDTKSKSSAKSSHFKHKNKQKTEEKSQPPQPIDLTEPIFLTPEEE